VSREELAHPWAVPIRILGLLARNGIHTTSEVHAHIRAGTLRRLNGVGPATERKILRYYGPAAAPSAAPGVEE
jgi:DNA polymerase/3'-5' exonuclease PolX